MRILLAIDGSEFSDVAVRSVAQRPWPPDSTLRVLSVAQPVYPPGELAFVAEAYERTRREFAERAEAIVQKAAEALRRRDLAVETRVRAGDPRKEIVAEAQVWGADLIIVGSHGRTGMKRWLVGSVAEHVVRHASCSVEVARAIKKGDEP